MKDKYKVLLLSSTILMSFSFIYDLPSTLNVIAESSNMKERASSLAVLYSVYALPNTVTPLIFDKLLFIGTSRLSEILCCIVFLGHLLYSIGVYKSNMKLMLIGRFVYGLGSESCSVIKNRIISNEFKNSNIAFAMGLTSSLARLGSIANLIVSPVLAKNYHKMIPCIIGLVLTTLSILCCKVLNKIQKTLSQDNYIILQNEAEENKNIETENHIVILKSKQISKSEQSINFSNIFYEVDFNQSPYASWETVNKDSTDFIIDEIKETQPLSIHRESDTIFYEPKFKAEKHWSASFILLLIISFCIALIWAPFYSLSTIIYKNRFNLDVIETSRLLAMIEIFGLIFTPIVGTLGDKLGQKLFFVFFGCLFLVIAHTNIYFKTLSPLFISIVLGLSGPLVSAYWPCIPSLVTENELANGFACIYCGLNAAFTISPVILVYLSTKDSTFNSAILFMLCGSIIVTFLTILLLYFNKKQGLGLNDSV